VEGSRAVEGSRMLGALGDFEEPGVLEALRLGQLQLAQLRLR